MVITQVRFLVALRKYMRLATDSGLRADIVKQCVIFLPRVEQGHRQLPLCAT